MTASKSAKILSKTSYIATLLLWATLLSGWAYASAFLPDEAAPGEIMSERTLAQLYFISLAWVVCPLIEMIAAAALLMGERGKRLISILALNAIPISFLVFLFIFQKGNTVAGYRDMLSFIVSPLK